MTHNACRPETLFSTQEYSDCSIYGSGGEHFYAHRVFVGRAPGLKRLIDHSQITHEEYGDVVVHLPETDAVVSMMLGYLYGKPLPEFKLIVPGGSDEERLKEIVGVVVAAEKYGIKKLAQDAYRTAAANVHNIVSKDQALRLLEQTGSSSVITKLQKDIMDKCLEIVSAG